MNWPTIEQIRALAPLPAGYRWDLLSPGDIVPLIQNLREWFPSITVGAGSVYLRKRFYLEKAVIDDESERDVLILICRFRDEMVAMGSWERELDALALYARLGAVAPAHRGAHLAVAAMELGERMGRTMGAGFIYGLATLKMPNMQLALERAGYQLIGFMPGYDREEVAPGVVKRVYEAAYAKRLAPEEDFLRPDDKNLTPRSKRLFDIIFPAAR